LVSGHVQPFLDHKLIEWRSVGRYELGKQMPNVILALDQLMAMIDEQIIDIKSSERDIYDSIDDEYAYNAFMTLIFKKQFLEKLEAPMVRLIKYYFVLSLKGIPFIIHSY
jgi:hypothetical protein